MRFALLSDLHCWSVNLLPWRLAGKRLVGMSNLILFRMKKFSQDAIERNVKRVSEIDVDYVLFAGDATQTSLLSEFKKARQMLLPVLDKLLAVPGNHDYYTTGTLIFKRFERVFLGLKDFPKNEVTDSEHFAFNSYPWVENIDNKVKIVGLNCAYPSFQAFGKVKKDQLEKLEAEIAEAKQKNQKLIILNHFQYAYPKNIKHKFSHTLHNADKLINLLKNAPKTLYIHGHIHKSWFFMPEITPNVLCINAASGGMKTSSKPHGLGFFELVLRDNDVIIEKHTPTSETGWRSEQVAEYINFWDTT